MATSCLFAMDTHDSTSIWFESIISTMHCKYWNVPDIPGCLAGFLQWPAQGQENCLCSLSLVFFVPPTVPTPRAYDSFIGICTITCKNLQFIWSLQAPTTFPAFGGASLNPTATGLDRLPPTGLRPAAGGCGDRAGLRRHLRCALGCRGAKTPPASDDSRDGWFRGTGRCVCVHDCSCVFWRDWGSEG